ncbi:MAG TPA: DNA glycosylase [Verrucomicrobiae bacterium]|jgi:N-glycosylase/DNA lyase|nr:DNA glycosylase [Verrucomicrobiae bacterium]
MRTSFTVKNYDLAATLACGQAFRWREENGAWDGVVEGRWVRLRQTPDGIAAETARDVADWNWLETYLQTRFDLAAALATFPTDAPMTTAAHACRGLRLLRQEPWECLASFICSSNKQIVQIKQIIEHLCQRFGHPLPVGVGARPAWSFPTVERMAAASEAELRACKMGFRAPYLLATAQAIQKGEISLERLYQMPLAEARAELLKFHGVGRKIADCVLLFGYGFPTAFPVDVWVMKALRQLYFPRRHVKLKRLHRFSETHFGPFAGYAQQYLFHYMRTRSGQSDG